jgi:hypothetical protein
LPYLALRSRLSEVARSVAKGNPGVATEERETEYPLLYDVYSARLAVSTDAGRAFKISSQYKIHTHNILYIYHKARHDVFRIL